ncbi:MAG: RHS repeat-associated core domain-containing protein, partial [Bacteroidales bacterium]
NNASITQGFLYAPFGELIYENDPLWQYDRIPKYTFNAKELDEENGMYYYSARYYAPPTFISRDPMFEKYPSISPYTYCKNNPVGFVDPTGETLEEGGGDPPPGLLQGFKSQQQNFAPFVSPEAKKASVNSSTASPKITVTNTETTQTNNQQQSSSSSSRTRADLPTTTETLTGTAITSKVVEGVAKDAATTATKGEEAAAQTFKSVSKGAKVFGTVFGAGSMFYNGYQGYKAKTFEKKAEYYTDAVMDGVGLIPGFWAVPIVWNCGGKQVYQKWQADVLMPQIQMGIAGSAASQPSK